MKTILLITCAALASCSTFSKPEIKPPDYKPAFVSYLRGKPDWRDAGDIRGDLGPKVTIIEKSGGVILDLNKGEINGSKLEKPGGQQDENAVGVKTRIKNFTIRNGYVKGLPGGIVSFAPDTTFQKLIFTKIGEDAVSNQREIAPRTTVDNCEFYNFGGDKNLQLNSGNGAIVRNSKFYNGVTSVRIQETETPNNKGESLVENCLFQNVETGVNVGGQNVATLKNNEFKNVDKPFVKGPKAKVIEK